jgi:diguanylate cyclase (GGDEF)-like protein
MTLSILAVSNGILIVLVAVLTVFLNKQINEYNQLRKNYSTITVIQKIMEVFGEKISPEEKLEKINNVFLKDFQIMFSTIVSYSENKHVIKASNIEQSYDSHFENLSETPMFKSNCIKNVPKYITAGIPESLKYETAGERGIRSVLFIPLYLQGAYAGYWILEDTRKNAFDRIEKIQLSILKNNLSLIIENSNYESAIEKMAINDKLTGMYNRNYLYTRGVNIINQCDITTVVICDIDLFKKVNDSYGHDIGDKVLTSVAQITKQNLSDEDVLVRFGGEEFVVLCPNQDIETCKQKIDNIRKIIADTVTEVNSEKSVRVTVSYGMSEYKRGEDIDAAIKNSDVALYRAKENGRNRIEIAP